MSNFDVSYWYR